MRSGVLDVATYFYGEKNEWMDHGTRARSNLEIIGELEQGGVRSDADLDHVVKREVKDIAPC